MVLTLSFAGTQVTLEESTAFASGKGPGFIVMGVSHFPDGHIEAEVQNFSGKIIITSSKEPPSEAPTSDEEAVRERESSIGEMADPDARQRQSRRTPKKAPQKLTGGKFAAVRSKRDLQWLEKLEELRAFKEEHGHTNVKNTENKRLASFVWNIRYARKHPLKTKFVLTDERMKLLDDLGFSWGTSGVPAEDFDVSFAKRLEELRAFKEERGHLDIAQPGSVLANFCDKVRRVRRNSRGSGDFELTEAQIASLDELGFDWCENSAQGKAKTFAERFEELKEYRKAHGHLNVKHNENRYLYDFVRGMRYKRHNPAKGGWTNLTEERIACLDAIGFDWGGPQRVVKTVSKPFADRIEEFRKFKEKHGHLNVEKKHDPSLYSLFIKVKGARKNPDNNIYRLTLTDDQIASLDAMGFPWDNGYKSFDDWIEELKRYKEKNGHLYVSFGEDKKLANFCQNMRKALKDPNGNGYRLTKERMTILNEIGFPWMSIQETKRWEKRNGTKDEDEDEPND